VTMFEQRRRRSKGAGGACDRDGDGGGTATASWARSARPIISSVESGVRLLPTWSKSSTAALRRRLDLAPDRSRSCAKPCGRTRRPFFSNATIRRWRYSTSKRIPRSPMRWRDVGRRQTVLDPVVSSGRSSSGPMRGLFRTKHFDGQGRCLGGGHPRLGKIHSGHIGELSAQTGPSLSPFNAWVLLKGLEDAFACACAGRPTPRDRRGHHGRTSEDIAPDLSGRPDHPQAGDRARQMRGGSTLVAFEIKRQGRRVPVPGRAQDHPHRNNLRPMPELDHPSGNHDAPTPHAGRARRARHQRWAAAALLRAGASSDLVETYSPRSIGVRSLSRLSMRGRSRVLKARAAVAPPRRDTARLRPDRGRGLGRVAASAIAMPSALARQA